MGKKILVVDDEKKITEIVTAYQFFRYHRL